MPNLLEIYVKDFNVRNVKIKLNGKNIEDSIGWFELRLDAENGIYYSMGLNTGIKNNIMSRLKRIRRKLKRIRRRLKWICRMC